MLGGAYSEQFKNVERQHIDTIKTLAENDRHDSIARAKKLSIETNKRRRALAIRRKAEAEKEEKRRRQILAKRRERQNEATERFQRGHISSRPSSGASSQRWSPRHTTSIRLEEALKIVRGNSPGSRQTSARSQGQSSPKSYYRQNSDPLSKPYFNKYAHPTINQNQNGYDKKDDLHSKSLRNLNSSRSLFEQQLESHQKSVINQQQKALQDFNQQLMKEIEHDSNITNGGNNANGIERSDSISTVDSLEDAGSNDTLRESCDLDKYLTLQNGNANNRNENSRADPRSGSNNQSTKLNSAAGSQMQTLGNGITPTIDSYNTQVQSYYNHPSGQDLKQQQYYQRQLEIQQQLQEHQEKQQMQQRQREEIEQRIREQQEKQKQMLQQQYAQKQQQEQQEKQRQAELAEKQKQQQQELERQRQEQIEKQRLERQKHQEMIERQRLQEEHIQRMRQEAENQRLQEQQQARQNVFQQNNSTAGDMDSQRPKIQMKAWATPSPQPPTPASATTANHLVTNASPHTGRSTNTNVTATVGLYDKTASNTYNNAHLKSNIPVPSTTPGTGYDLSLMNAQSNITTSKAVTFKTDTNQEMPNLSFLESVTRDLTGTTNMNSPTSNGVASKNQTNNTNKQTGVSSPKTTVVDTNSVQPQVSPAVGKNSPYFKGSYSASYAAKQQTTTGTGSAAPKQTGSNTVGFSDQPKIMVPTHTVNGDTDIDTDSVSTICDEKEPEPKEVRSILKRANSAGPAKKPSGILKKSGSTGNMKDIRDSLEITRVQLQTPSEEREQKILRELERANNPPPPKHCFEDDLNLPVKKNVRFADLCYDDESEDSARDMDDAHYLNRKDDIVAHKPPRPASAVALKTNNIQMNAKPPRASSASARTSTIPRAKTQVVKPQAAAHIITQGSQSGNSDMEYKKKVTIVNNDFMQKVPAMARNNQTVHTVTPASVYSVSSVSQTPPQAQKVNYAVSSIIMPKSNSAPFMYTNYPKPGPSPTGSAYGPSEAVSESKYEGAMFDENGVRIDRTPTDDEINFLWDKLRSCLHRSTSSSDKPAPEGHRQAAPVANTYIDGNALGQYNSLNRVAQPQTYNNGLRKQNSLDSAGNTYSKRYGLLQQRRQQPNPNSLKARQALAQSPQGPVQSFTDPQPSPSSHPTHDVSESMAGFLVAEHLADQSVTESAIHQAMDDVQARHQAYNSVRPQPKVMSALSLEEKHVMESLDRLNDKLKVAEPILQNGNAAPAPVPRDQGSQPHPHQHHPHHAQPHPNHHQHHHQQKPAVHMGGFKGHTPISQRRVIESATHKARLRITSAALKKNIHRTQ